MTKQGKPQQPELRRSERGRVDREHWKRHQEVVELVAGGAPSGA